MAQATKESVQLTDYQQRQLNLVKNIDASVSVDKPNQLASNLVDLWKVQVSVAGGRPSDPKARMLYDEVTKQFGSQDEAIAKLNEKIAQGTSNLAPMVSKTSDMGNQGPELIKIFREINTKMLENEDMLERYLAYRSVSGEMNYLSELGVEGPPVMTTDAGGGRGATAGSYRRLELSRFSPMGNMMRIATRDDDLAFAMGGTMSNEQSMLFGVGKIGQNFVNQYASALAADLNGEPQDKYCGDLLDAMKAITNPQILNNPAFQDAMLDLAAGKRSDALAHLRDKNLASLINTAYDLAKNMNVIRINQDAMVVLSSEAILAIDIAGKKSDFDDFLSGDKESMGRAYVQFALAVKHELLRAMAVSQVGTINEEGNFVPTGKQRNIDIDGQAVSVRPELSFMTAAGSRPIKITVHSTVGYRWFEDSTIEGQNGPEKRRLVPDSWYWGVTALEFQLPLRSGEYSNAWGLWFDRVGIGTTGGSIKGGKVDADIRNSFLYFTVSKSWKNPSDIALQTYVTPIYSGFMSKVLEEGKFVDKYMPRLGGEVDPLRLTAQVKGHLISAGLPVRVDYDFNNKAMRVSPSLDVAWKPNEGLEFSAGIGYAFAIDNKEAATVGPGGLFGKLGLTIYPGGFGTTSETSSNITKDTVPVPTSAEVLIQQRLLKAADFVNDPQNKARVSAAEGQDMAKKLGSLLDKYNIATMPEKDYGHFSTGVDLLHEGKLREGLKELSIVPELKIQVR